MQSVHIWLVNHQAWWEVRRNRISLLFLWYAAYIYTYIHIHIHIHLHIYIYIYHLTALYSERASLCIIREYINLLLFSSHKAMGFPAPHTETLIDLHNQPLVLNVRLYGWFNNADDITQPHNVIVTSLRCFYLFPGAFIQNFTLHGSGLGH